MENYLRQRINLCITKIDEYAERKGEAASNQWHYWCGQLAAYQEVLNYTEQTDTATV